MSSISNFITLLNSTQRRAGPEVAPNPGPLKPEDVRILQAVLKADLLQTKGLASVLGMKPDEAAEAVERLRVLNQIELVQSKEDPPDFFVRLTPSGYETLKTF
jgi:DNA-binding MarR family transcriptional regulator